jgi:hypothetical protein
MWYFYLAVSFALGLSSRRIRMGSTVLLSLGTVALGVVLNSWRWIDVGRDGPMMTLGRVATEGMFWYLLPSAVIFALAFLVGRVVSFALARPGKH